MCRSNVERDFPLYVHGRVSNPYLGILFNATDVCGDRAIRYGLRYAGGVHAHRMADRAIHV